MTLVHYYQGRPASTWITAMSRRMRAAAAKPADAQTNAPKVSAEEAAANHDKLCADAQERYKKLAEGRHLYKVGDDGQRQYMTSDQIDAERISTKAAMDNACGQ